MICLTVNRKAIKIFDKLIGIKFGMNLKIKLSHSLNASECTDKTTGTETPLNMESH